MPVFSGGTVAGNVIPDVTGRDHGSLTQRWDLFAQNLDVSGTISLAGASGLGLRGFISVRDYGALGDGTTDDTAAIQAAITASASGGIVFFPATSSYYKLTAAIILQSNIYLLAGNYCTLTMASSGSVDSILKATDLSNVRIEGFNLNANNKATSCIYIYSPSVGCSNFKVCNNTFSGTPVDATKTLGCINVTGSTAHRSSNMDFSHNQVTSAGTHGIVVAYCDGVVVADNFLSSCTNHGSEAVTCTKVVYEGNVCSSNTLSGLGVGTNTSDFSIIGNRISACGGDGAITVENNSVRGVVSGNTLIGCTNNGINLSYGNPITSPYNKVRDVAIKNNIIIAGATTTKTGILAYSSTSTAIGEGILLCDNVIDGFNIGIDASYFSGCCIEGNIIKNYTGSTTIPIKLSASDTCRIARNNLGTCSGDIIQLLTANTVICTLIDVDDNIGTTSDSANKSFVTVQGAGDITVQGNISNGAKSIVAATGASTVYMIDNRMNLAGSPWTTSGGSLAVAIGNSPSTQDIANFGSSLTTAQMIFSRGGITLANGANNDIALGGFTFVKITGPTGVFNITGFAGGADGRILTVFNSVAFAMTITNNATSAAANRITTLTGGDVVLRAGTSFATFIYESGTARWILMSTN